ncbi:putative ISXO2-like transposase domain containing protein [Blattamonas nauphoetae]|uniref:ISXO2-like transposase domain containing protein n=1 Tax=Blattamonas nauphoetae TaxID=2049346 RepID=A0ABQ9YCY8_9EUKA|nr:putative ISXO2-like transposase domain containing protein [Blattamonas nauphoetae]
MSLIRRLSPRHHRVDPVSIVFIIVNISSFVLNPIHKIDANASPVAHQQFAGLCCDSGSGMIVFRKDLSKIFLPWVEFRNMDLLKKIKGRISNLLSKNKPPSDDSDMDHNEDVFRDGGEGSQQGYCQSLECDISQACGDGDDCQRLSPEPNLSVPTQAPPNSLDISLKNGSLSEAEIENRTNTHDKALQFAQNLGLLPSENHCPKCEKSMPLIRQRKDTDKFSWTCHCGHDFRLIAMAEVLLPDRLIGGKDIIVEKEWIVGGYCQADSSGVRQMFLERVANRDAQTLRAILQKHIAPGSTVVTDGWAGYHGIESLGFNHQVVIHKRNEWVNKEGFTTNHIEAYWRRLRQCLPPNGVPRWFHDSYFYLKMYRDSGHSFLDFCQAIGRTTRDDLDTMVEMAEEEKSKQKEVLDERRKVTELIKQEKQATKISKMAKHYQSDISTSNKQLEQVEVKRQRHLAASDKRVKKKLVDRSKKNVQIEKRKRDVIPDSSTSSSSSSESEHFEQPIQKQKRLPILRPPRKGNFQDFVIPAEIERLFEEHHSLRKQRSMMLIGMGIVGLLLSFLN